MAAPRPAWRASSSAFTAIRRAWKTRVAGQLLGGLDRSGPPGSHDGPRDAAGLGFLAVAPEQGGELTRVQGRQDLGGRRAAARVEAHVERPAGPEAEAAGSVGQLLARQAKIEVQAVHRREPGGRGDVGQLAKVRLAQHQAVAEALSEATIHSGDGRPVGVETQEAAIRIGRLQDPLGVPTAADGRVDLKAAGSRCEHRHDLVHQHRQVPFLHLSSTVIDRIPSGPWKRMWFARRPSADERLP